LKNILPESTCLACFAGIKYLNFTNAFPTEGPEIPVSKSGLGITIYSIGPNYLHSSSISYLNS